MELRRIEVDRSLRENIGYKDASFPVDIWTDVYNHFVDKTMNCHWHHEFEFGVMVSGQLDYYMGGRYKRLKKGDCVFVNSNTLHMASQPAGCNDAVMFTIVFPPSLFTHGTGGTLYQKYFQPIIGMPMQGFVVPQNTAAASQISDALWQTYQLDPAAFGYELRCLGLLSQAWAATAAYIAQGGAGFLSRPSSPQHEQRARDILSYIHRHYTQPITVDDIARHINVSRSECFRCFGRFTGKRPVEYINDYRLAQAARLLAETDASVAEVGVRCGFSSSSYFGKLFRQKYGLAPLQYRHAPAAQADTPSHGGIERPEETGVTPG